MMFSARQLFITALSSAALVVATTAALAQPEGDYEAEESTAAAESGDIAGEGAGESALVAEVEAAEPEKSKGLVFESEDGRFKTQIQARVQGRYEYDLQTPDGAPDESAFSIARARLTLKGHAFEDEIGYKFQADWGKGNLSLKDFYVDYQRGAAYIRVGQYKRPFSRQQITSSGNQALVDRAITDKAFGAGRDIGVMVHNNFEKSPTIEWAVGLFNATGDKAVFTGDADPVTNEVEVSPSNVPAFFGPALVARVGYNGDGIKGYSEADLEGGPLRYGVAASVMSELDADDDDSSAVLAQVDYIVKVNGLSSTGGVYVATAQDGEGFADQAYSHVGFHLQGGYMLSDMHQVVGRYALVSFDGEGDPQQEITAGYSLYKHKHGFKWQTDAGLLASDGVRLGDAILIRTQLQLSF